MLVLLGAGFVSKFFFGTLVFVLSLFLILLVLVQRGKGGGLTGALGGMGGQSAFGTKAGDMFTRITIITAAIWILTCWVAGKYFTLGGSEILKGGGGRSTINSVSDAPGDDKTTDKMSDKSGTGIGGDEKSSDDKATDEKATDGKETGDKSTDAKETSEEGTKAPDESSTGNASSDSDNKSAEDAKTDESKDAAPADSSSEENK